MPSSDIKEFLRPTILYLVNVYEPCAEKDVKDILSGPGIAAALRYDVPDHVLRSVLESLEKSGFVFRTSKRLYTVTSAGLKVLAAQRMAFPRDKHRLYYLKKSLLRRGQ
jgi:hypothetical protein